MRFLLPLILGLLLWTMIPASLLMASEAAEPVEEMADIEEVSPWDSSGYATLERTINIMMPYTLPRNDGLLVVDHRVYESFMDRPFHDFLGFDAGSLKIGLGLRFAPLENLEIGAYRLSDGGQYYDIYEFDLKYRVLQEERHYVSAAIRAGATWFSQEKIEDASGFFGQLLLGRTFMKRLYLGSGVLYASDSTNPEKFKEDPEYSLAIPGQISFRIIPAMSWNYETAVQVAGYGAKRPVMSTSLKFMTNRHTFSVVVSNTQDISADGIVTNTARPYDKPILGFTITRQF